ncbi:MAG TPA: PAS domain-containing protein [Gaiellaceae bacterium]|nr:PAS domain-containing protein [Gaiellaceae bacterium]
MSSGLPMVQLALLGEAASHASGVAVFVWDDDRTYVAVNDAACELVGLEREELLAMRVGELSPDRAEPHFTVVQRREFSVGSSTFHRRDGIDVPVEWVSFHTTLAGLPYMGSVVWPARRS